MGLVGWLVFVRLVISCLLFICDYYAVVVCLFVVWWVAVLVGGLFVVSGLCLTRLLVVWDSWNCCYGVVCLWLFGCCYMF